MDVATATAYRNKGRCIGQGYCVLTIDSMAGVGIGVDSDRHSLSVVSLFRSSLGLAGSPLPSVSRSFQTATQLVGLYDIHIHPKVVKLFLGICFF